MVGLRFKLYKNKGFFFAEKKFFVFLSIATARRRRAAQQLARARARALRFLGKPRFLTKRGIFDCLLVLTRLLVYAYLCVYACICVYMRIMRIYAYICVYLGFWACLVCILGLSGQ